MIISIQQKVCRISLINSSVVMTWVTDSGHDFWKLDSSGVQRPDSSQKFEKVQKTWPESVCARDSNHYAGWLHLTLLTMTRITLSANKLTKQIIKNCLGVHFKKYTASWLTVGNGNRNIWPTVIRICLDSLSIVFAHLRLQSACRP